MIFGDLLVVLRSKFLPKDPRGCRAAVLGLIPRGISPRAYSGGHSSVSGGCAGGEEKRLPRGGGTGCRSKNNGR